jgi:serine/threonine-protein phosphatase 2A regulatory subunit B'
MHRVPNLDIFHPQLGYCVVQFVDKDGLLAVPVIQGLLKFWPQTNSAKEVLLLTELEEILELTSDEQFASIIQPLFSQLALCIGSPHFQVSERMLFFWHNEYITGLVLNHREEVLPIIFSALQRNSQSHWNEQVATLSLGVLKLFIDTDSTLVDRVSKELEEKDISYANNHASNQDAWAALTTEVKFKTPVFEKGDYSYGKAELLKEQAVERKSR